MDCSPPGSSVHGILKARILEWVGISFPSRSSCSRNQTQVSCIAGRFFTIWATREALLNKMILLQLRSYFSRVRLCDPIDSSPPGSPVPGILQARTLEWVAISFSKAWSEKWKWSRSVVSNPQRPHGLQPTMLLHPWDFPGRSTGVGWHCLLPSFCR